MYILSGAYLYLMYVSDTYTAPFNASACKKKTLLQQLKKRRNYFVLRLPSVSFFVARYFKSLMKRDLKRVD